MRKTCLSFIVVLISFCCLAPAQDDSKDQGTLSGAVARRASNSPLGSAMLYIQHEGTSELLSTRVGNVGQFEIPLPAGEYNVFVVAQGYAPACKKVTIAPRKTEHFVARLNTDMEAESMEKIEKVDPDALIR